MKTKLGNYILPTLVATLLLAGLVLTFPSAASAPGPSANGHGTLIVPDEDGDPVRRQFSLSAKIRSDGTVTGNAVLHNPAFSGANGHNYQLQVEISCMRKVGNIAIFGGSTRRTNDPNLVDAVFFSVQDNGEPGAGNDKISRAFFFDDDPDTMGDPQGCLLIGPSDLPLETIEAGNIQVRQ